MLFVWTAFWVLAFIIFKVNKDNREMRWIAFLCFFSGTGALCSLLRKQVIPNVQLGQFYVPVRYTVSVMHSLVYVMAPYCMGVYCVITSKWINKKVSFLYRHIRKILLIPPILMYILFPVQLKYRAPFVALSLWVVPLCFLSNSLLVHSYFTEKNVRVKQQRLVTCLLLTPPTVFATIANYVLTAAGNHAVWEYVNFVVLGILLIFIIGSATYGAMGIRLRFERYRIEAARKTSTSGTSILSHTLKNEAMKISICTDNVKHLINNSDDIEYIRHNTCEDLKLIELSSVHMLDMMRRIQDHLKDLDLDESSNCLNDLVDEGLLMVKPYLDEKEIIVQKNYEIQVTLLCDPLHIKETLMNIFKNSIEAMNRGGKLSVHLYRSGKWIMVAVHDDGAGIEKGNLPYVLDPFFSTKRTGINYGLGLSYCYNVMRQHHGNIEINSEKDSGTTVCLSFSARKAVDVANIAFREGVEYGENKGIACG